MKNLKFTFVGGDLRLVSAHSYIKKAGFPSNTFLLEKAESLDSSEKCIVFPASDIYVLPLPASSDGKVINSPLSDLSLSLKDFFSLIPKGSIVFGGLFKDETKLLAKDYNIALYDYYDCEELQIKNAVPTAEGALEIALREMPVTLFSTDSILVGYGRISKVLAPMLSAMGSKVKIASRNAEGLIWADIAGFDTLHTTLLSESVKDADLIINTAPSLVLTGDVLGNVKKDCLIIDLASKPGGVDIKAASSMGIKVIWALGLPGKCAPVSSGHIIGSTILSMLKSL